MTQFILYSVRMVLKGVVHEGSLLLHARCESIGVCSRESRDLMMVVRPKRVIL
jgi:hypothetical protein